MNNKDDLIIDILADHTYTLDSEYSLANEIIEELIEKNIFLSKSFSDNIWYFSHEYSPGRKTNIDFNKVKLIKADLHLIKCWVASLLQNYKPTTCNFNFHYLSKAINMTNFFSLNKIEDFNKWLYSEEISNNVKTHIISSTLNFFDYSEITNATEYLPVIINLKKKIRFIKESRKLPSSKSILEFSFHLENYFIDIQKDSNICSELKLKKYLLYSPLLIWWQLTNIIPMRSTEFSIIRRNCIFKKENSYFIKIPRIKDKIVGTDNIRILNEIEINKNLYTLIENYIDMTNKYGNSKTLISYMSLIYADFTNQRQMQKKDISSFNKNNFEKLLARFYKEVIKDYYDLNIEPTQKVKPNDTRHFAFISLMMQGINPVEIARLGGHKTIGAQYHYSFHTEYWIDNEVFKLMKNYKNIQNKNHTNYIPQEIKLKAFEKPTSSFRGDLNIGYCSDALQRCEADECMLCSHWRIDKEELNENHFEIIKKINNTRDNVTELMNFIQSFHKNIINEMPDTNDFENDITRLTTLNKINSEIINLTKLTNLKEGNN